MHPDVEKFDDLESKEIFICKATSFEWEKLNASYKKTINPKKRGKECSKKNGSEIING